jgi:hypothetical protein
MTLVISFLYIFFVVVVMYVLFGRMARWWLSSRDSCICINLIWRYLYFL